MPDINYSNGTVRRDDWRHKIGAQAPRTAKRVPLSMIKEKPVDYEFVPAVKPEIHPLRMPKTMEPQQVDWTGGREYFDRKQGNVRLVPAADIDQMIPWMIEKIRLRFPRVDPGGLANYLKSATRDGQRRFLRTDNACALFQYEKTVFEPQPIVREIFVVSRDPQTAGFDIRRLYSAGMAWAIDVRAVEFHYGGSTGIDITPVAKRIGYDFRRFEFAKRLPHAAGTRG